MQLAGLAVKHFCTENSSDQFQNILLSDLIFQNMEQICMPDAVKKIRNIHFEHPEFLMSFRFLFDQFQRLQGRLSRPVCICAF